VVATTLRRNTTILGTPLAPSWHRVETVADIANLQADTSTRIASARPYRLTSMLLSSLYYVKAVYTRNIQCSPISFTTRNYRLRFQMSVVLLRVARHRVVKLVSLTYHQSPFTRLARRWGQRPALARMLASIRAITNRKTFVGYVLQNQIKVFETSAPLATSSSISA
jgi:hypothetical protein